MAKVKYRVREFTPTANQSGGHSFYAEAVVDNIITNNELAKKIEARGISRRAEIKAVLEMAAEIILEETAENNRIQLESGDGGALVSIYPTCSGSVSDKDVQANPEKYNNAQVATEEMLTADMIAWTLGATVGRKFAKQFAMNKQAMKVEYNPSQEPADPDSEQNGNGGTQNQGGGTNDNGGGDNGGGYDGGDGGEGLDKD